MFRWDRTPDPSWQRELDSITPRDGRTWLKVVWQSGEPYDPVQRWEIYEMVPPHLVGDDLLQEFREAPPRERGEWYRERGETVRRWRSESLVSRLQYNLWQETHHWPQRLWIVQGAAGGHSWVLTPPQAALFELKHPDGAGWPDPGDLPYAEPGGKTWAALRARDKLGRMDENLMSWERRFDDGTFEIDSRGKGFQEVLRDQRKELNREIMAWMDEQFYGIQSLVPRGTFDEVWQGAGDHTIDEEAIEREFVEAT